MEWAHYSHSLSSPVETLGLVYAITTDEYYWNHQELDVNYIADPNGFTSIRATSKYGCGHAYTNKYGMANNQ